jgi:hypothetical protein
MRLHMKTDFALALVLPACLALKCNYAQDALPSAWVRQGEGAGWTGVTIAFVTVSGDGTMPTHVTCLNLLS